MKSNKKGCGCLSLIGLAVIIGIITAVSSHSSSNTPTASASASLPIAVNASTKAPADTAPTPAAPASSAPTAPSMTTSQQQAVNAAESYLSMGQGFSAQGLLQQLTSSAGSSFTEAQAEYAINHLDPDWDAQAVDAAMGYLQLGGFSRASLLQQLTSSAGSGFTEAQAEYAVNQTMK